MKNIGFWFGASCLFVELVVLFIFLIRENIIKVSVKMILRLKPVSSPSSKNNTKGKQQQELETIHVESKQLREHTYKSLP